MRILFTGGTGKAGRHVVPYLRDRGHRVVNVDLQPLGMDGVDDLTADITDSGQMFNVLTSYANFDELEPGTGVPHFDAVVHFAAVPRILIRPDNETFRINTVGTYNVIEAAVKLGIRKIIFASSETTYGICFNDGPMDPPSIPIDEDVPVNPMDSYGLSKVVNEQTARAFQRRSGADVYGLRIGNVIEPHEYAENFPAYFRDPDLRLRNAFCYIDARDLGQIVDRCLATDGLGYRIFNAANDGNSVALSTPEIIERYYRDVPQTRPLGPEEGIYSNARIRQELGFVEEHPWTRHVADPRSTR
ncbi:NAD-dependent epimerase/dehydratase family protein [Oceanomicrobium pacificus]|uniref:NAD-dependent epimerase/dehydratase family protein n=1 Tax=Oceanomicrobium pacificus TaxID=2692916 RepID=A0A6B0TRI4_9RHOB|nr:NAD(P)-dependent oxidoreductase [Oceanomicrobium pacificus]MXU66566.1 NAD-dependent epimerase/dehydratase family protein [Oceanomicrobium pacificus]